MQVTIFRGSKEVGGSCIEVQSGATRIILDVGMPIFDENREPYHGFELARMTTAELEAKGIAPNVSGLFSGEHQPDAILLSHAHLDHVGLLKHTVATIPVYASKGTSKMMLAGEVFANQSRIPEQRFHELRSGTAVTIGDFNVSSFAVDHSIFGCLAFLVEADGKRLLYTGDLRLHGNQPQEHHTIINTLAGSQLDALIIEGTHFGWEHQNEITETQLQNRIVSHVEESPGLVLSAFSPQHLDRLRSFIYAAKESRRTFVADVYTAFVLYMASRDAKLHNPLNQNGRVYYPQSLRKKIEREGTNKVYERFRGREISIAEIEENPEKFVMVFRPSMLGDFVNGFPHRTTCIFSTWHGYSALPQWQQVQTALASANGCLVHAHTSGHAMSSDIVTFTGAINAKTIIPVHTFEPQKFHEHFPNVIVATDGQPITL